MSAQQGTLGHKGELGLVAIIDITLRGVGSRPMTA
jgi:hypothetical protein